MQTQVKELTNVKLNNPSVSVIILNINNSAFKIKGKSYEVKLLGKPMFSWVEKACKPYKTKNVVCGFSESVMQVVLPELTDADVTVVLYADTPLIKHSTIVSAIDFLVFKELDALKLPRGFVFNTSALKSGLNLNINESFFASEEEFFAVTNCQAVAEASSVLQTRINNFHMLNGVHIENPKTVIIESDVAIGANVNIYSGTVIKGNSQILDDVTIKENCVIENSTIESGAVVFEFNKIINSVVHENALILGFNSISANSEIGKNASIENFCSIKGACILENEEVSAYSNLEE